MNERESMRIDSAKLYNALNSFKDYRKESLEVTNLIRGEHLSIRKNFTFACVTADNDRFLARNGLS